MIGIAEMLKALPPLKGKETVIVRDQDTADIVEEVLDAHNAFKIDYDAIAGHFTGMDSEALYRQLFEFCRDKLLYRAESEKLQTTRSPAGIIALAKSWGVDCKHYAGFIGGILDAVNRRVGAKKHNWDYRFVSYDLFNEDPGHVFVVVKKPEREIWLDPAPVIKGSSKIARQYNDRIVRPWYTYDKKATMALVRINGPQMGFVNTTVVSRSAIQNNNRCGCAGNYGLVGRAIGEGEDDEESGAFLEFMKQAGKELKEFFSKLFSGGWQYTTGVRWLTAYYQYYVLGDANATGSTKVNEANTPDAQGWFAVVSGVPIYDRYRLHALMGTNPADGTPLGKSDSQKAADYLALGPDTSNIDPKAVAQAVQILKKLRFGTPVGSWKQFSVAAPPVVKPGGGGGTGTGGDGSGNGSGDGSGTGQGGGIMEFIRANPLEAALLVGVVGFGTYHFAKRKTKS